MIEKLRKAIREHITYIKKERAKKATNREYKKAIRNFLERDIDLTNEKAVASYFSYLHQIDNNYKYDKNFSIAFSDTNSTVAGRFIKNGELKQIKLYSVWNKHAPAKFIKRLLKNTDFHEEVHNKQYEKYLFDKKTKRESNPYQKILNFEMVSKNTPQYDFKLSEIDARMRGFHKNCNLLKDKAYDYDNADIFEPVTALLKNLIGLTDLEYKVNIFNNKTKMTLSDRIPNFEKIENIEFEIDNYIELYKNFLNNLTGADTLTNEYKEAREVLNNNELKKEFKRIFTIIINTYKDDMKYYYDFIKEYYPETKQYKRFVENNNESDSKLFRENNQIVFLKFIRNELFDCFIKKDEKTL